MKINFHIFNRIFKILTIYLLMWLPYLLPASATSTYSNGAIYIYGTNENLTSINSSIANPLLLENIGNKEWLAKVPLIVNDTSTIIYINDSDVSWLKLLSLNNINISYIYTKGIAEISNTKITSWNTNNNKEASISDSYRSYIYIYGSSARTNISNSNLSYLGYEYGGGHAGVNYQSTKSGDIRDSIFTNNYRGLYLNYPGNIVVNNNTISNNRYEGMMTYGNDIQISNNSLYLNKRGLEIRDGYRNKIENNIVRDNIYYGIVLGFNSNQNSLMNDTITNDSVGVYINGGVNNNISNSIITNNIDKGIYLEGSSNGNYTNNLLSGQGYGFYISNSMNNILRNNNIFENQTDAIYINGNKNIAYYNHSIDITNTVNNKSIYYYPNKNNYILSDLIDAGKIIVVNSNNVNVRNVNMSNGSGILFIDNNNSSIIYSFFNNLTYAISLKNSDFINISNNSIGNMRLMGVNFDNSNHIVIGNNTISRIKNRGIQGSNSNDVIMEFNNISYTDDEGINLETVKDAIIRNNDVFNSTTTSTGGELIRAWGPNSYNISFIGNHAYNSAEDCLEFTFIKGGTIKDNIIDRCTSGGIEIYGYTGTDQYSEYITIENNTITKSNIGIIITDSDNNTLFNNDIDQNNYGIYLENRYSGGRDTINNTIYGISPYDNLNDIKYDLSDNTILYAGKRDEIFPIDNKDSIIYTRSGDTVLSENYYLKNDYLNITVKLSDGKVLWTSKKIPQNISMELYPKLIPTNFSIDSYDITNDNKASKINFTISSGIINRTVVNNTIIGRTYHIAYASNNTIIDSKTSSSSVEFIIDLWVGTYIIMPESETSTFNISGFKLNSSDNKGLPGWTIRLLNITTGLELANKTTDSSGFYNFTGLANGTYNVTEVMKQGWMNVTPTSLIVTITGTDAANWNFTNALIPPAPTPTFNISGFKLNSSDNKGLPGWTIRLLNITTGLELANKTTDSSGFYNFTGLANGTYNVTEVMKQGWMNVTPTSLIVTITGTDAANWNFTNALIPPAPTPTFNISGFKLNSSDNKGLPGWTIRLLNITTGLELANKTTDSSGFYNFTGLANGTYNVTEVMKQGWMNVTPTSLIVTITGTDAANWNFTNALIPPAPTPTFNISGFKLNSSDNKGLPGWTIRLLNITTGLELANKTTDSSGFYNFTGLANGTYNVTEVMKQGWMNVTPTSLIVTITGTDAANWNFTNALIPPAPTPTFNISGFKLNSSDNKGLPGWTIRLLNITTGLELANKTTDSSGFYNFTGLANGTYNVTEVMKQGWMNVTPTSLIVTITGTDAANWNFTNALIPPAPTPTFNISGFKLNSSDNKGLPGWTIRLLNITTGLELANKTTDSSGFYNFTGLANGTYNVTEVMKQGWMNVTPTSLIVTITGTDAANWNFTNALIPPAPTPTFNISGFKLNSSDNKGLPDWTIRLLNITTGLELANKTTDSSGFYNFTGLANGTYNVTEVMKQGWMNVTPTSLIVTITGTDAANWNFTNALIPPAPTPNSIWSQDAHDELIVTTQDNPLQDSLINPTIYTGYGLLYNDKYGRIWARTSTKNDLYMYNGTWNKMFSFGNSSIYSVYYTNNDILMVSLDYTTNTSGALMRSTNNATTFSNVLTFTNDTYQAPWSYGSIGNKIVIGEYGARTVVGQTKNVWLSTDNGLNWNRIFSTNSSQTGKHIHQVGIDNVGTIYINHGDIYKDAVRSTDNGVTWNHFGITDQYTSMAFANNFIIFGNDPSPQFIVTNETNSKILVELPVPWTNFISRINYVNGVFYAIQSGEFSSPYKTGLWISTNGRDWYLIYNLTDIKGTFTELEHDSNNFTWGALSYYNGLWKNRLLTVDEANELIYGNLLNRTIANDPQYFSFSAMPLTNANITIYGRTVNNLVSNPSFESDFTDWKSTLVSPDTYNIDNTIYHSGGKSVHVVTTGPGSRGKIYQTVFKNNIIPIPAGTNITWSGWVRLNSVTENSAPASPYDPLAIIGVYVKFQDGSSFDDRSTRIRVNTGGKWARFSVTKSFSKPIVQIDSMINFYQKSEAWVDDIQVQIGELSPYIAGSANTSGSLNINGELITIPNLGEEESVTINIKNDLNGFVTVIPNLEGNKIATIKISGAPNNNVEAAQNMKYNYVKNNNKKMKKQKIVPNPIPNEIIDY